MSAVMQCSCNKKNTRIRWSCQEFVPGTEMRVGNLALVAAAQVAPVSYPDLSAMFNAVGIPMMTKRSFLEISKNYVWPTVRDSYYKMQSDLIRSLPDRISISMDGQYDSPGYSAELCAVTAIEGHSHQVLDFSVTHKSEVNNVSGRMELAGTKKCIESIERHQGIESSTLQFASTFVRITMTINLIPGIN
jgi:hypothetical protein